MSRKRNKRRRAAEQEEFSTPRGSIPADLSKQAPNNSYGPPLFYEDLEFTCRDCGSEEVWTAEEQQWYYEVAKGSIYGRAVQCWFCRKKIREAKDLQRQQMEAADERRVADN
tara:strand:- start:104891 stop:105226 length:336 start_codon:yes stop_codon:yes gene_type:complete